MCARELISHEPGKELVTWQTDEGIKDHHAALQASPEHV